MYQRRSINVPLSILKKDANLALSFEIYGDIRKDRDGNAITVGTDSFEAFGLSVPSAQPQYGIELVFNAEPEHVVDPKEAAAYPGLKDSIHQFNHEDIEDDFMVFYDVSKVGPRTKRPRYMTKIWMSEFLTRVMTEARPRRLGRGDEGSMSVAGMVTIPPDPSKLMKVGGEHEDTDVRGFIIVVQRHGRAVYLDVEDVNVVIEAYLTLLSKPEFHAFMRSLGAETMDDLRSVGDIEASDDSSAEATNETSANERQQRRNAQRNKRKQRKPPAKGQQHERHERRANGQPNQHNGNTDGTHSTPLTHNLGDKLAKVTAQPAAVETDATGAPITDPVPPPISQPAVEA